MHALVFISGTNPHWQLHLSGRLSVCRLYINYVAGFALVTWSIHLLREFSPLPSWHPVFVFSSSAPPPANHHRSTIAWHFKSFSRARMDKWVNFGGQWLTYEIRVSSSSLMRKVKSKKVRLSAPKWWCKWGCKDWYSVCFKTYTQI